MAIKAYIPRSVQFAGQEIAEVLVVTLYDAESTKPMGGLTCARPPALGSRGRLEWVGTLRKDVWRVVLPEVEVVNRTGFGCEFRVAAPADGSAAMVAECLEKHEGPAAPRAAGVEEKFAIR